MEQIKTENDCLWMVKGISSIIVILFHCRISGIIGDGIIYALRFPIPIFLMSTGFYLYGKNDYINRAKVFLKYLLLAETIACISLICSSLIESQSFGIDRIIDRLFNSFNLKTLLFGSIFNGTLWYLYSMVWTFVFLHFASKTKNCFIIVYYLVPILLIIHIVGRVYVEYSCAMKSHFRKSGNQMSGKWKSSCACLLA